MISQKKFLFILLTLFCSKLYSQVDTSSTTWILDRADYIGGFSTSKLSELPLVVETTQGKSLLFDGVNRAVLVKGNPLGSSKAFTIEIILRPDSASAVNNKEQRYLHVRSSANDNRRVMMELRLLSKMRWTIDTYIKSETSGCTLLDDTTKTSFYSHPVGPWYHVALVYENGIMRHFINGIAELTGQVIYIPIDNGQISIGARQDPKSWFKGAIRKIKFTRRALLPSEFIKVEPTAVNGGTTTPSTISLDQNYPNPFNPETVIRYTIKEAGHVSLKVYNLLGKEVVTLVDEYRQPGIYSSLFSILTNATIRNGLSLSTGVYYYQLRSGSFVETKKLVMIK